MLQTIDFSAMKVDPNAVSGNPALVELFKGISKEEIRYVVVMYDSSSPLKNFYTDIKARKLAAAEYAGLKKGYDLEGLFNLKTERLADAVGKFLQHQNSLLWTLIVANEEAFDEYSHRVISRVDEGSGDDVVGDKDILTAVEKKTKLLQAMHDIRVRLDSYHREFYGDDNVVKLEVKLKRATPENMAANVR